MFLSETFKIVPYVKGYSCKTEPKLPFETLLLDIVLSDVQGVPEKKHSLVRTASISLRNIFSGTPGLFEFLTLIFTLSDYFSILSLSNFILWFKIFFSGKLCSWGSNNSVPRTNHFISEEVVSVHLQCQIFWQNVPA